MTKATKKIISLITLLCFAMTQSVTAYPGAGIDILGAKETPSFFQIDIPSELATLDGFFEAPAQQDPKLIFHIQNAHANYGAQEKIKQLLQYLDKTYAIKTIFVEGASEDLNPNYLKMFPDRERNLKLADLLAKQGELTGAELFVLGQNEESNAPVAAHGIENAELYRENYDALKKVFGAEVTVNRYLSRFEGRLEGLASKVFGADLRRLLGEWKKFEKGHREFMPYIRALVTEAKRILKIDLESLLAQVEWPQISRLLVLQTMEKDMNVEKGLAEKQELVRFLKEKQVSSQLIAAIEHFQDQRINVSTGSSTQKGGAAQPRDLMEQLVTEAGPKGFKFYQYPNFSLYSGYLILKSELDPKALYEEIQALFRSILDELAVTSSQKTLLDLYRDEELIRKLLNLELTRKNWQEVLSKTDQLSMDSMVTRLRDVGTAVATEAHLPLSNFETKEVNPKFRTEVMGVQVAANDFYEAARNREEVFYEKIDAVMKKNGQRKAVLITGGFHTDGITDLLREHEISYGILTPRLSEKSDEQLYRSVMLQDKTSLFELSYLEAAPKLISAQALKKQGVELVEDLKVALAGIRAVGDLSLDDAIAIFNGSEAASLYRLQIRKKEGEKDSYKIITTLKLKRNPLTHRVISFDGPSAVWKSESAEAVANELGYLHVDTGSIYRSLTAKALAAGTNLDDASAVEALLQNTVIKLTKNPEGKLQVLVDGRAYSVKETRNAEVTKNVGLLARHLPVAEGIAQAVREVGETYDCVIEGRNIGTDIFPENDGKKLIKFYLTAEMAKRAERRHAEYQGLEDTRSVSEIQKELEKRDKSDNDRDVTPLWKPADAVALDNSPFSFEQNVAEIMKVIRARSDVRENAISPTSAKLAAVSSAAETAAVMQPILSETDRSLEKIGEEGESKASDVSERDKRSPVKSRSLMRALGPVIMASTIALAAQQVQARSIFDFLSFGEQTRIGVLAVNDSDSDRPTVVGIAVRGKLGALDTKDSTAVNGGVRTVATRSQVGPVEQRVGEPSTAYEMSTPAQDFQDVELPHVDIPEGPMGTMAPVDMKDPGFHRGDIDAVGSMDQTRSVETQEDGTGWMLPLFFFHVWPSIFWRKRSKKVEEKGSRQPNGNVGVPQIQPGTALLDFIPGTTPLKVGPRAIAPQVGPGATAPQVGPASKAPQVTPWTLAPGIIAPQVRPGATAPQVDPRANVPRGALDGITAIPGSDAALSPSTEPLRVDLTLAETPGVLPSAELIFLPVGVTSGRNLDWLEEEKMFLKVKLGDIVRDLSVKKKALKGAVKKNLEDKGLNLESEIAELLARQSVLRDHLSEVQSAIDQGAQYRGRLETYGNKTGDKGKPGEYQSPLRPGEAGYREYVLYQAGMHYPSLKGPSARSDLRESALVDESADPKIIAEGRELRATSWSPIQKLLLAAARSGRLTHLYIDIDNTLVTPQGFHNSEKQIAQMLRGILPYRTMKAAREVVFPRTGKEELRAARNGFYRTAGGLDVKFLEELRKIGVRVVALTARPEAIKGQTFAMLSAVGLHEGEELDAVHLNGKFDAIVFTGSPGREKAVMLEKDARESGVKDFRKVVYLDDQSKNTAVVNRVDKLIEGMPTVTSIHLDVPNANNENLTRADYMASARAAAAQKQWGSVFENLVNAYDQSTVEEEAEILSLSSALLSASEAAQFSKWVESMREFLEENKLSKDAFMAVQPDPSGLRKEFDSLMEKLREKVKLSSQEEVDLLQSFELAMAAHQAQKRKGSDRPYFVHQLEVARRLLERFQTADPAILALIVQIALFHDTREDQEGFYDQVRTILADEVNTMFRGRDFVNLLRLGVKLLSKIEAQEVPGGWEIRYRNEKGADIVRLFKTKAEADDAGQIQYLSQLVNVRKYFQKEQSGNPRYSAYTDAFIRAIQQIKLSDRNTNLNDMANLFMGAAQVPEMYKSFPAKTFRKTLKFFIPGFVEAGQPGSPEAAQNPLVEADRAEFLTTMLETLRNYAELDLGQYPHAGPLKEAAQKMLRDLDQEPEYSKYGIIEKYASPAVKTLVQSYRSDVRSTLGRSDVRTSTTGDDIQSILYSSHRPVFPSKSKKKEYQLFQQRVRDLFQTLRDNNLQGTFEDLDKLMNKLAELVNQKKIDKEILRYFKCGWQGNDQGGRPYVLSLALNNLAEVTQLLSEQKKYPNISFTTPSESEGFRETVSNVNDAQGAVLLIGGADSGKRNSEVVNALNALARANQKTKLVVLDSGTEAGAWPIEAGRIRGEQLINEGDSFYLVGAGLQKHFKPDAAAVQQSLDARNREWLFFEEPNHSHLLGVIKDKDSNKQVHHASHVLLVLAEAVSKGKPSVVLLQSGGNVTVDEWEASLKTGRQVLILQGTGRAADVIAYVLENPAALKNPKAYRGKLAMDSSLLLGSEGLDLFDQVVGVLQRNPGFQPLNKVVKSGMSSKQWDEAIRGALTARSDVRSTSAQTEDIQKLAGVDSGREIYTGNPMEMVVPQTSNAKPMRLFMELSEDLTVMRYFDVATVSAPAGEFNEQTFVESARKQIREGTVQPFLTIDYKEDGPLKGQNLITPSPDSLNYLLSQVKNERDRDLVEGLLTRDPAIWGSRYVSYAGIVTSWDVAIDSKAVWAMMIDTAHLIRVLREEVFSDPEVAASIENAVEYGTGGGAVAAYISSQPNVREVVITDIVVKALSTAMKQLEKYKNPNAKVRVYLGAGDTGVVGTVHADGTFDFVTSNPPYIPRMEGEEKVIEDTPYGGTTLVKAVLAAVSRQLNPKNPHAQMIMTLSSMTEVDLPGYVRDYGNHLIFEPLGERVRVPIKIGTSAPVGKSGKQVVEIGTMPLAWKDSFVRRGLLEHDSTRNDGERFFHYLQVFRARLAARQTDAKAIFAAFMARIQGLNKIRGPSAKLEAEMEIQKALDELFRGAEQDKEAFLKSFAFSGPYVFQIWHSAMVDSPEQFSLSDQVKVLALAYRALSKMEIPSDGSQVVSLNFRPLRELLKDAAGRNSLTQALQQYDLNTLTEKSLAGEIRGLEVSFDAKNSVLTVGARSDVRAVSRSENRVELAKIAGLEEIFTAIESAPPGSTLYLDIDDTLLTQKPEYENLSSSFVGKRYWMIQNSVAHMNQSQAEVDEWKKWAGGVVQSEYDAMETAGVDVHIGMPVAGAKELIGRAKQRGVRIALATNRPPEAKEKTFAVLRDAGFELEGLDFLFAGVGSEAKAQAILSDIKSRGPPSQLFFIDNDKKNTDRLAQALAPGNIKASVFNLEVPASRQRTFAENLESLRNMAPATKAEYRVWELRLLNAILSIPGVADDAVEKKAGKLAAVNELLDLIEQKNLNQRDFIVNTNVYQYLYEIVESAIDVPALITQQKDSPNQLPGSLRTYLRVVFPTNYKTAERFYRQGRLPLRTSSERDWYRKYGAQAQLTIDASNLYLFLEPILQRLERNDIDSMIFLDTGARPYSQVLQKFVSTKGLKAKSQFLPASFHDVGDTEEDIRARLIMGKIFQETGGDVSSVRTYLQENKLFPDLLANEVALRAVADHFSKFFPMGAGSKVLLFDDNVGSGKTVQILKRLLLSFGLAESDIEVAVPLVLGRRADRSVDSFSVYIPGHVSWTRHPPKIAVYPSWEENYAIRGVTARGKGEHLVRENPNDVARAFQTEAVKAFTQDLESRGAGVSRSDLRSVLNEFMNGIGLGKVVDYFALQTQLKEKLAKKKEISAEIEKYPRDLQKPADLEALLKWATENIERLDAVDCARVFGILEFYHDFGGYEKMRVFYETAKAHRGDDLGKSEFLDDVSILEFYAVSLNKRIEGRLKQLKKKLGMKPEDMKPEDHEFIRAEIENIQRGSVEVFGVLEPLLKRADTTGESFAALGKAWRNVTTLVEMTRKREDAALDAWLVDFYNIQKRVGPAISSVSARNFVEQDLSAYKEGFLRGFEFYPGHNTVLALRKLARMAKDRGDISESERRAKEAAGMARLVFQATQMAGGVEKGDEWCLGTVIQALLFRDHTTAGFLSAAAIQDGSWQKDLEDKAGDVTDIREVKKVLRRILQYMRITGRMDNYAQYDIDSFAKENPQDQTAKDVLAVMQAIEAVQKSKPRQIQTRVQQGGVMDRLFSFSDSISNMVHSLLLPGNFRVSAKGQLPDYLVNRSDLVFFNDQILSKDPRQVLRDIKADTQTTLRDIDAELGRLASSKTKLLSLFLTLFATPENSQSYWESKKKSYEGLLKKVNAFEADLLADAQSPVGIYGFSDEERFNAMIDIVLRYRMETQMLEDFHSTAHGIHDAAAQGLIDATQARITRDSTTTLAAAYLLGISDCREHAYLKQIMFDMWKSHRVGVMMRHYSRGLEAQVDVATLDGILKKMDRLSRLQMFVFDAMVRANFSMKQLYEPLKSEDGKLIFSPEIEDVEAHTLNVLLDFDESGNIVGARLRDSFYQGQGVEQEEYKFSGNAEEKSPTIYFRGKPISQNNIVSQTDFLRKMGDARYWESDIKRPTAMSEQILANDWLRAQLTPDEISILEGTTGGTFKEEEQRFVLHQLTTRLLTVSELKDHLTIPEGHSVIQTKARRMAGKNGWIADQKKTVEQLNDFELLNLTEMNRAIMDAVFSGNVESRSEGIPAGSVTLRDMKGVEQEADIFLRSDWYAGERRKQADMDLNIAFLRGLAVRLASILKGIQGVFSRDGIDENKANLATFFKQPQQPLAATPARSDLRTITIIKDVPPDDALDDNRVKEFIESQAGTEAFIFLSGGAAKMSADDERKLLELIEVGLRLMAERSGMKFSVMDGGTQAGIMKVAGLARKACNYLFDLIGIVPQEKVKITEESGEVRLITRDTDLTIRVRQGGATLDMNAGTLDLAVSEKLSAIDPNHSTVFAVAPRSGDEGKQKFGHETKAYGDIAGAVSNDTQTGWHRSAVVKYEILRRMTNDKKKPSINVLANGGLVTFDELKFDMAQERPTLVIRGSGRAADVIAEMVEQIRAGKREGKTVELQPMPITDEKDERAKLWNKALTLGLNEGNEALFQIFDMNAGPEAFYEQIMKVVSPVRAAVEVPRSEAVIEGEKDDRGSRSDVRANGVDQFVAAGMLNGKFDPAVAIEWLKKSDPSGVLTRQFEAKKYGWEGGTLQDHAVGVARNFEINLNRILAALSPEVRESFKSHINMIRLLVAVHDIGEPTSHEQQHEETEAIINDFAGRWNLTTSQKAFMLALLFGEPGRKFLAGRFHTGVDEANEWGENATQAGIPAAVFYAAQLAFWMADSVVYDVSRVSGFKMKEDGYLYKRDIPKLVHLLETLEANSGGQFKATSLMAKESSDVPGIMPSEVRDFRFKARGKEGHLSGLSYLYGREVTSVEEARQFMELNKYTTLIGIDAVGISTAQAADIEKQMTAQAKSDGTMFVVRTDDAPLLKRLIANAHAQGFGVMALVPLSLFDPASGNELPVSDYWIIDNENNMGRLASSLNAMSSEKLSVARSELRPEAEVFKEDLERIRLAAPSFGKTYKGFSRENLMRKLQALFDRGGPSDRILRDYLMKAVNRVAFLAETGVEKDNLSKVLGISGDVSALYEVVVNRGGILRSLEPGRIIAVNPYVYDKRKEVDGWLSGTIIEAKFDGGNWDIATQGLGGDRYHMSHLEAIVRDPALGDIRNMLFFAENDGDDYLVEAALAYLRQGGRIKELIVTDKGFSMKLELRDMPGYFFNPNVLQVLHRERSGMRGPHWVEMKSEMSGWINAKYKQMRPGEHFDVILAVSNADRSRVAALKQFVGRGTVEKGKRSEVRPTESVEAMASKLRARDIESKVPQVGLDYLRQTKLSEVGLANADKDVDVSMRIALLVHGILALDARDPSKAAGQLTALAGALGLAAMEEVLAALPADHVMPVNGEQGHVIVFVSSPEEATRLLRVAQIMLALNPALKYTFVLAAGVNDELVIKDLSKRFSTWAEGLPRKGIRLSGLAGRFESYTEAKFMKRVAPGLQANSLLAVADRTKFRGVDFSRLGSRSVIANLAYTANDQADPAAHSGLVKASQAIAKSGKKQLADLEPSILGIFESLSEFEYDPQIRKISITNKSLSAAIARVWQEFRALMQTAISA